MLGRNPEMNTFINYAVPVAVVSSTIFLSPIKTEALTINRNFLEPGTPLGTVLPLPLIAGEPSENVAGGGDLVTIFNTAADLWEAAILDDHTIDINFGWLDFNSIGSPDNRGIGGSFQGSFPPTNSFIGFNNIDSVAWFLDSTPRQNEEYQQYTETVADLGGGELNIGQVYTEATGDAVNRSDMLSLAIHEIGHALGFFTDDPDLGATGNPQLTIPSITTTAPRPFLGTVIPTTTSGGGHIDGIQVPTTLMQANLTPGITENLWGFNSRYLLSGLDILAIAQTNNFSQVNLNPVLQVPESNYSLSLLGLGILGACMIFKGLPASKCHDRNRRSVTDK